LFLAVLEEGLDSHAQPVEPLDLSGIVQRRCQ
jgi:hypothetical protein